MKNAVRWFASSLVTLYCLSACKHGPTLEFCIVGKTSMQCHDERRDPKDYDRPLPETENYICTNADDYFAAKEWVERNCSNASPAQ